NGIRNVEFRQGDRFAPAFGETFDIIASQPPFVAMPSLSSAAVFLHGGRPGDEVALELLARVAPPLAPSGPAVLRVGWPMYGDAPLDRRLRDALGAELDLLVLAAPAIRPDEHAAEYAAGVHALLGPAFEEDALQRLEHLERAGIRGIVPSFTVLEKAGA